MDILRSYTSISETTDTLFSICIYNQSISDVKKYFENELEKAKKISNINKKIKINNRLFQFIKYLQDNFEENLIMNHIFLLYDKVINYELTKKNIQTAHLYKLQTIFVKCDTYFHINYFIDFFYNFQFIYSIKINKNDYSIIQLNKYKIKELEHGKVHNEQQLIDVIDILRKTENYKDLILLFGNHSWIDKIIIKNTIIYKNIINDNEIYEIYEKEKMKENHNLLKKRIDDIKNENTNLDLYVFGKIRNAIETYSLKELYIEDKKLERLKTIINEEYFNFRIIPIKSLEPFDIANTFIKDYNGIIGIKYF